MPQEVVEDPRTIVQLDGRNPDARQVVERLERCAAVVEMPDVDHQAGVARPGSTDEFGGDADVRDRRPGKCFDGDEQATVGKPVGVGAQCRGGGGQRIVGVQGDVAVELAGADMPAAEGVCHCLDSGESRCKRPVFRDAEGPAAEELDLHQLQAVDPQDGLHVADAHPGRDGAGQIIGVQPDAAESGGGGRLAAPVERVARRLAESCAGQGEEAGHQLRDSLGVGPGALLRVNHGRP